MDILTWEEKVKNEATEMAKQFNNIGFADPKMGEFMKELFIYWINESDLWCEQFVKVATPDKVVLLVNYMNSR